MKRSCCLKSSPAARRGIELSRLTIIKAITVPLILVAVDVASDGNMLYFMSSIFESLRATDMTIDTLNNTDDNVTGNQQDETLKLIGLFNASCFILGFSLLNLLVENPIKTLIRNARTSVLMKSREMESKDVPVPIGNYTYYESTKPTKLDLRPPSIQTNLLLRL